MKFLLVLLTLSTSAFAHIKFGTYEGKTIDGDICSVRVIQKTYFLNIKHPLNEEILIEASPRNFFKLTHPVVIDQTLETVGASHDSLNGQNGDENFSRSFSLAMSHDPGQDGPKSFKYTTYNYKTKDFLNTECLGLNFKE